MLPAPAATGYHATTTTSSPPSVCTSGMEVATVTVTTSCPGLSARGCARCLHQANRVRGQSLQRESQLLEENLPLEGPHLKEAPCLKQAPHLEGQQAGGHATWGGFSQSREARPAAPADRPQVPPPMPTELESICACVGLHLHLLLSTPAQQRGKILKTQGAWRKAHSLPQHRLRWPHNAVNSLYTPAEGAPIHSALLLV